MSYNGSGVFQINTSGQPVVAGTVITASAFNALTADLATGLTTAITKDGQTATTAQIPFAAGLRSTLTTDSTTSTSGSIITDGGLGVAKAANIGTTLGVTGAITGSSTITGTKLIPTGTSVTGNGMYLPAANTLGFSTNGTNAVTIDSSQNVGVGVTPSALWSNLKGIDVGNGSIVGGVSASYGTSVYYNAYYNGTNSIYKATGYASYYGQGAGQHQWFNAASGTAGNAITFTQAMTLDASGNLLVGTTTTVATTPGIVVSGVNGSATNVPFIQCSAASSTNTYASYVLYSTSASAYRFYVDYSGTVHATSIVITAISDERLKENVRDIDTGLDSIMALKPRRFDWKEGKGQDKKNAAGFIAQEFEQVFPECVSTSKAGGDGIEYKNINHETLIPTLVKAIQEQQALITSLTARITALEA